MFGRLIERDIIIDKDESDRFIDTGKTWKCQDWGCPAKNSCAKHFGLSLAYARMQIDYRYALLTPSRDGEHCAHWRRARRDHFAESLGLRRTVHHVTGNA